MSLFPEFSGAIFSPCGQYRYRLWRTWNAHRPTITFVMLNPSTADDARNDPTVERCQRRAQAMGYGGLRVANVFALRSTDPAALYAAEDPVGPDNDAAILALAGEAALVVCAWGTHGQLRGRGQAVLRLLRSAGARAHHLGLNADGTPKHPLYVGYDIAPRPLDTD
jgi:hypothetical protein